MESAFFNPRRAPVSYRVSASLRSTHGQDGAVVLDVSQGRMFSLNRVGARMLELMKSGASESEIVVTIVREFEAKTETVEEDLRDFMATLKRHSLINQPNDQRSGLPIASL